MLWGEEVLRIHSAGRSLRISILLHLRLLITRDTAKGPVEAWPHSATLQWLSLVSRLWTLMGKYSAPGVEEEEWKAEVGIVRSIDRRLKVLVEEEVKVQIEGSRGCL